MIASFTKDGNTAFIRLPVSGRKLANALAYIGADCAEEYLRSCNGQSTDDISVSLQEENSAENLIGMRMRKITMLSSSAKIQMATFVMHINDHQIRNPILKVM